MPCVARDRIGGTRARAGLTATSLISAVLVAAAVGRGADPAVQPDPLDKVFAREAITIVVTDSGLGGLAVAADLEHRLRTMRAFARVRLVFVNALPQVDRPYNAMATRREQVETFDRALAGMTRWYAPDVILVACNTLSVIAPDTTFARTGRVPVVGIVEAGVRALAEGLAAHPSAVALVLGTTTTIRSGAHRAGLLAAGIDRHRVHEQACPSLESEIQRDPDGDLVQGFIETYGDEAGQAMGDHASRPVVVGLCCSHYGYSRAVFQEVLGRRFQAGVVLVDPNAEMTRSLAQRARPDAWSRTDTDVRVVSRAQISIEEQNAIAAVLAARSPKTAAALRAYERKMDLFEPRS